MKGKLKRVLLFTRFTWLSPRPGIKCNLKILKHFATSWQMKARPIMSTAKCLARGIGDRGMGGGRWVMGNRARNQKPGTRDQATTPTTGRNDFLCQYFSRAHNFDLSSATLALIVLIMAGAQHLAPVYPPRSRWPPTVPRSSCRFSMPRP